MKLDINNPAYEELKELINKHSQIADEFVKSIDCIGIKTAEYKEYQKKRKKENPRVSGSWISENYLWKRIVLLIKRLFQVR
ncbi:MAG: hypothetical protein RSD67_05510 [Oscillospiraceae bacterium]